MVTLVWLTGLLVARRVGRAGYLANIENMVGSGGGQFLLKSWEVGLYLDLYLFGITLSPDNATAESQRCTHRTSSHVTFCLTLTTKRKLREMYFLLLISLLQ